MTSAPSPNVDARDDSDHDIGDPNADDPSVGDHTARTQRFEKLYDALYDDLWRYGRRRTISDQAADDLLSEVMMVAWRRLDDIPPGDRTRPWLFGVARNHLRSQWRGRRRDTDLTNRLINDVAAIATEPDVAAVVTDEIARLAAAVAELAERDRELIQLAVWDELPHAEISLILDCSENAVAIRLHRVRANLAKATEQAS